MELSKPTVSSQGQDLQYYFKAVCHNYLVVTIMEFIFVHKTSPRCHHNQAKKFSSDSRSWESPCLIFVKYFLILSTFCVSQCYQKHLALNCHSGRVDWPMAAYKVSNENQGWCIKDFDFNSTSNSNMVPSLDSTLFSTNYCLKLRWRVAENARNCW